MVVVGRPATRPTSVSYVDVDNRQGAPDRGRRTSSRRGRRVIAHDRRAGRHGRRHRPPAPAIATRSPRPASGLDPTLEAVGDFTQEGGAAAMRRLLAARPDIDAVFAASDLMAAGALTVLAAAGRRVPEDVAVVGFDDSPIADDHDPAAHQRPPADRGDGPRDGPPARRPPSRRRTRAPARDPRHRAGPRASSAGRHTP